MSNLLKKFEQKQLDSLSNAKALPKFKAGDTVRVHLEIIEGNNKRIQAFEGVCLKRRNHGIGSTFSVKKISNGEMVERNFMLYSPRIAKIEVLKIGRVRRAKLYYMRELTGKAARIREEVNYN